MGPTSEITLEFFTSSSPFFTSEAAKGTSSTSTTLNLTVITTPAVSTIFLTTTRSTTTALTEPITTPTSALEITTQTESPCASFDCMHGGSCVLEHGYPKCECKEPYFANHCERPHCDFHQ